jgi:hypothetical protein
MRILSAPTVSNGWPALTSPAATLRLIAFSRPLAADLNTCSVQQSEAPWYKPQLQPSS